MLKPLILASHNWKALLKSIVYQAILLALVVAFAFVVFGEFVDDLIAVMNENHLSDFANNTLNSVFTGEFNSEQFATELDTLLANVRNAVESMRFPWGGITTTYLMIAVMFVLYRMLVSITDVTVGCQIEEFMTSNAERPFIWYFVKRQGKSWQFVLLQTAIALPMEMMIVCGCIGFYLLSMHALKWWAIILVAILALLFYVVRLTVFAFCMPAVVCNEETSARKAFNLGISMAISRFWRVFWKTLIVVIVMVAISVISILFVDNTIASAVLLTVPNFVLFFYLKCINMVEYFRADNRPYFYKRVEVEGTERYNRIQARKAKRANKN